MNKPTFFHLVLHFIVIVCFLIAIQACKSPQQAIACQSTNPPCCQTTPDDPCYTIRQQLSAIRDSFNTYDIDTVTHNGCPVMRNEVITDRAYDSSGYYLRLESGPFKLSVEYIAEACPCDSSILLIDTTNMPIVPNELSSRSTSKEKSNGNGVFVLPPQFEYEGEFGYVASFFKTKKEGESPSSNATKVAIIDSGLSSNMANVMSGQITNAISLVENGDFNEDQTGHGDVVTAILDEVTDQIPELFIYRIINNDKISTSFKLACALRCAQRDQADIVNMSLGNYINDTLLHQIIEEDFPEQLQNTILIASKGNDCLDTENMDASSGHYPSDYDNVFDVMGLEIDIAKRLDSTSPFKLNTTPYSVTLLCLWECSNRTTTGVAPCRLTDVDTIYYGTSFAAPFASAKAADYMRQNPGNGLDDFVRNLTTRPIQIPGDSTFLAKIVE